MDQEFNASLFRSLASCPTKRFTHETHVKPILEKYNYPALNERNVLILLDNINSDLFPEEARQIIQILESLNKKIEALESENKMHRVLNAARDSAAQQFHNIHQF